MAKQPTIDSLYDKIIRWTFTDGPMAGAVYEHTFHKDGTVDFKRAEDGGKPTHEQHAAVAHVADDIFAVSYLGTSGYTLTVVLDCAHMTMTGFASNEKEWVQQKGTFEVLE